MRNCGLTYLKQNFRKWVFEGMHAAMGCENGLRRVAIQNEVMYVGPKCN